MRRIFNLTITISALVFVLSGCTEKWAKPGGTDAEFQAMKGACSARSYARFPPMMETIQLTSGYVTPVTTSCSGFGYTVNCYSTGGQYVPPAMMTIDRNQNARNQDTRSCFYENGWQPVKNN